MVLSGDVEKLKDLDLTVEVRPSAKIIDTHNYADENSRKEVTVMMNGGLGCLPDIGDGKEHCKPCGTRPHCPTAPVLLPYHIEDNTLIAMWTADRQFATGDYDIMLYAHKNEGGQAVCDQYRFVRLVSHTAEADAPDDGGIEAVIAMQPVTLELSGLSAYEVAVVNGFQGTEEEWLESLKVFTVENLTPENFATFINGLGYRITEKIDINNIDSLGIDKNNFNNKPAYYLVMSHDDEERVIGTLQVFFNSSDALSQILLTNYTINENGGLNSQKSDSINFYSRSYDYETSVWNKWSYIIKTATKQSDGLMSAEDKKKLDEDVATLNEDKKLQTEQMPALKNINGESLLGEGNITVDLSAYQVSDSVPDASSDKAKIYLVTRDSADGQTTFDQYVYKDGAWTNIGEYKANIDFSGINKIIEWNTDAATTRLQVKQSERKAGIIISYNSPNTGWVNEQYVGTSFTDSEWQKDENWEQAGKGGSGLLENAARISGFIRIRPREEDMLNQKRFINVSDGTFTLQYSTNPDARIMKIDVSPFQGGTIEYENRWLGITSRACIAFYSSDFTDLPTSDIFIEAEATQNATLVRTKTIPDNAVVAAIQFTGDAEERHDVVLKVKDGNPSSFDERIQPIAEGLTADYVEKDLDMYGCINHVIDSYETKRWLDGSGGIVSNVISAQKYMAVARIKVLEAFKGGRMGFYSAHFGFFDNYSMLAFFNSDDEPIKTERPVGSSYVYRETEIPSDAEYLLLCVNLNFPEGKTLANYPVTMYAAEDSLTVYGNSRKIQQGHKDYPLPLGVMDNLLVDVSSYGAISKQFFITSPFARNAAGMLYQVTAKRSVRTNAGTVNMDVTFVFRIKKSANPNRLLRLINTSGALADFNDEAQPGPLYHQNSEVMGYVIRQEKEYLWVYGRTEAVAFQLEVRLISYADSSKQEYEELELDMDRSFVIPGNYELEELDIDKKYYTRPEKLHSNLVGKTCIVFADSLSAFVNSLAQDWGMNIVSIAEGGNRMGYYTGHLSNWICEDEKVQNFRSYGLQRADYIVFAMGANDPSFTQCTADDVQFVLQNKRWFNSDAETDPFDSLQDNDKNKFGAAASLYAAAYSLCRLYPDAIIAIIPPYKTPGTDVTEYDAEKYASVLFNGRFESLTQQMREVATTLGAIFIENRTRNNAASADTYHGADGVHPKEFAVYQDMASNIGHELSKCYDIAYNQE